MEWVRRFGIEDGDRGGSEDSNTMGTNEGGDALERMRQGGVGQEISRDRRGFVRKSKFTRDVGLATHK
jgi:hypothetical protein